ncbi:aromatic acid exporter family protein [Streptomyces sp. NPDC060194]|uniref:FUSC family protein n=1 Tax=Streptomyces sp. NPDC060194 TaxID=3347069 RepID=UPI00365DBB16
MRWLRAEAAAVGGTVRRAVTRPGPERDLTAQSLKAAGAAVLAWAVAGWWWGAPMALMAPWTAVILVQSTVYRSLRSGVQQLAVIAAGTLIAAGAAALTGDTMTAMLIAVPLTVFLGNYARFGPNGVYAPTTALFVLAYGSYTANDILHRLLECLIGAVIGIAVNALILPPVHLRDVRANLRRLPESCASLLATMADDIDAGYDVEQARAWHDRTRQLGGALTDLRHARQWTEESYRFNPGRRMRRPTGMLPPTWWDAHWDRVTDQLRALTVTLAESAGERPGLVPAPDPVLYALAALLRHAGEVCAVDVSHPGGLGPPARTAPGGEAPAWSSAHRGRELDRAWEAHRQLKDHLVRQDVEVAPAVGGLVAQTQQLLTELGRTPDG